ncbi:4-phosphoerythronate dehydrogenase [Marinospirillum insulare]|uniref:Erythronate-4-phosphate dehydrogenase n=1 Tax=Marinospirillum insulare TaxID=217169 RepID=A0ABQ5ZT45_9GAMM|nr:4-phosphoerythronate dehydrogenase [Marinospirillum insulare]GLR62582.1 erythronate-4-phosphate dehydrogenase [Marinospirillum insulare]
MRLIVDENLPFTEAFFGKTAELVFLPGSEIKPADVKDADGLLVRSVTQVNEQLLQASKVKFVGTATIGVDHIDEAWLNTKGIKFVSSPGCNANSVVDYVVASLLWLALEDGFKLKDKVIGVVGVGQVGGRLAARLSQYGCKVLLNDPPRAIKGEKGFLDLHDVLQKADIVCLHTPLTSKGEFATKHLVGVDELALLEGKYLLNAGRGGVVDQQALKNQIKKKTAPWLLLDVFEGEPSLDQELITHCLLATPHIAGYSLEGKSRGTEMLYQAWCMHLGIEPEVTLAELLPVPPVDLLSLDTACGVEEACRRAAHLCYHPLNDSWRLLKALKTNAASAGVYQALRKNYPIRREFSSLKVKAANPEQASALKALGFTLS